MMEDLIGQIIAWLFATTCYGLATWGILYFAFNAGVQRYFKWKNSTCT